MISLTSEYALRAMIYLARNVDNWPISGGKIAEAAGIPRSYLSAILGNLVRAGILDSSPGAGGGFRMNRPAKDITLSEVFAPFEPILTGRRPCPFGKETCSDEDPCAGHNQWKKVRETYSRFLEKTSVHDVSFHRRKANSGGPKKRKKR